MNVPFCVCVYICLVGCGRPLFTMAGREGVASTGMHVLGQQRQVPCIVWFLTSALFLRVGTHSLSPRSQGIANTLGIPIMRCTRVCNLISPRKCRQLRHLHPHGFACLHSGSFSCTCATRKRMIRPQRSHIWANRSILSYSTDDFGLKGPMKGYMVRW